jgi:TatA/E family protein of Tat protein translocase
MFGIGPVELLVVFVVALLVFGPTKLPELARSLGKGLREFRRASSDLRRSIELDDDDVAQEPAPAQAGSPHEPPEPGSALDEVESRIPSEAHATHPETKPEPVAIDTSSHTPDQTPDQTLDQPEDQTPDIGASPDPSKVE